MPKTSKPISRKKQKILDYLKQNPDGAPKAKPPTPHPKNKKKDKPHQPKKRKVDSEDHVELTDEDMEFFEKYGDSSDFLGDLDTVAIKEVTTKQEAKKKKRAHNSTKESEALDVMESRPRVASWDDALQFTVRERLPYKMPDGSTIQRSTIIERLPETQSLEETPILNTGVVDTKVGSNSVHRLEDDVRQLEAEDEEDGGADEEMDNEDAEMEEEEEEMHEEEKREEEDLSPEAAELKELQRFQQLQETIELKKAEIALYSQTILASPETNIDRLQKLFVLCHDPSLPEVIHNIALLSIAAVFKDILPGYKIVLQNLEDVKLSKEKKRIHDYESQLLRTYQDFVGILEKKSKEGGPGVRRLVAKASVTLLTAHPHFNFRTSLINLVVALAGIPVRGRRFVHASAIALQGIEELFANDITSGQATLETVRRIAAYGKQREYRMNPDLLKTFTALKLSEDVGEINPFAPPPKDHDEPRTAKEKLRDKKQFIPKKEKKRLKKEREIEQQLMTAAGTTNRSLVVKTQREILRSVFATYFRVIKVAPSSSVLPVVLSGLAVYSHLISVDFLSDVINVLRQICEVEQRDRPYNQIQCCLAVFKTLKAHGDALNVDLKDFYAILYSILPFALFSHESKCWLPLINALTVMIAQDRKAVALERIAAFAKRILTLALHTRPHLSISLVYIVRVLLSKFPKVQQLLGAEYTYAAGTYNGLIDQPDHCGPFATSLWEIAILRACFHPTLAKHANDLATCTPNDFITKEGQIEYQYHAHDASGGGFNPPIPVPSKHRFERSRGSNKSVGSSNKLFVRPVQFHMPTNATTTPFTTANTTTTAAESKFSTPRQSPPTATFTKYFQALQKFNTQKELFRLKQILAKHKAFKSTKPKSQANNR